MRMRFVLTSPQRQQGAD